MMILCLCGPIRPVPKASFRRPLAYPFLGRGHRLRYESHLSLTRLFSAPRSRAATWLARLSVRLGACESLPALTRLFSAPRSRAATWLAPALSVLPVQRVL